MPNDEITQSDGKQAYTQALMTGVDTTWLKLRRNRWPKEWASTGSQWYDGVLALY